jgi:hypothetical protein
VRRLILSATVVALALFCISATATAAVTLEPVGKFAQPISISSDPGNAERLLVAERRGVIDEVVAGTVTPLADISSLVACCKSERGLLSIAPAPDFDDSGRIYVAYTGKLSAGGAEGDIHVDSFRPGPSATSPAREPILSVVHDINENHNGGQLQFGPDGHLYISLGDGGGGGDLPGNAQNTEVLLGKILRIDPDPGEEPAYTVPAGNPFFGQAGPKGVIWAYGLRNPWRFSFDRTTGDMVIGDVGQDAREEVDFAPSPGGGVVSGAGANYGWNCREGLIAYTAPGTACGSASGFTEPVFDYPHTDPGGGLAHGCSIIGGFVVRDPSLTSLYGRYVYSDFCSEEIRSLVLPGTPGEPASGDRAEGLTVGKPTSFGEDACGRLYAASDEGTVFRLVESAPRSCAPEAPAPPPGPAAAPTGPGLGVERKDQPLQLRLQGRPVGARLKIVVEATPCAGQAGNRVQLNRGGKPFGTKRLDDNCLAHFFARVKAPATFRALLIGSEEIRSPRLTAAPHISGAG